MPGVHHILCTYPDSLRFFALLKADLNVQASRKLSDACRADDSFIDGSEVRAARCCPQREKINGDFHENNETHASASRSFDPEKDDRPAYVDGGSRGIGHDLPRSDGSPVPGGARSRRGRAGCTRDSSRRGSRRRRSRTGCDCNRSGRSRGFLRGRARDNGRRWRAGRRCSATGHLSGRRPGLCWSCGLPSPRVHQSGTCIRRIAWCTARRTPQFSPLSGAFAPCGTAAPAVSSPSPQCAPLSDAFASNALPVSRREPTLPEETEREPPGVGLAALLFEWRCFN